MQRRMALALLVSLTPIALSAQGKGPAIPAGAVGTWNNKTMVGPKDSVVATSTITLTADGKVTVQFPGRPLLTAKVLAAGGDSVVTEIGPYESVVKKGLMTTTTSVGHYKGNTSSGTFTAKYNDGTTLKGKTSGTKK